MERFTERDIELWRQWMGTSGETGHALTKFTHEDQLAYFADGVNDGTYSWRTSSLGYFDRAIQKRPLLEVFEGTKLDNVRLQISRNLGKSAHNHMVLIVYADMFFAGHDPAVGYEGVLDEVGRGLKFPEASELQKFISPDRTLIKEGLEYYEELQRLQDEAEYLGLRALALDRACYMNSGFLAATQTFGWSKPGSSSTDDVEAWLESA